MNSIVSNYGSDSSSDDSDSDQLKGTNSSSDLKRNSTKIDYLGLTSSESSSDECELPASLKSMRDKQNLIMGYADTLLNAYEHHNRPAGPVNACDSLESRVEVTPVPHQRTRHRKCEAKRVKHYIVDKVLNEDDGTLTKLSTHLSEPHTLIYRYSCRSSESRPSSLPRHSNITSVAHHASCVNALQWGPQLVSYHLLLSASMDGSIKIWDGITKCSNSVIYANNKVHGGSAVRCARWHPTQELVLSGGFDKNAIVTNIIQGAEMQRCPHPNYVNCLKIYPEQSNLFLTGSSGSVYCWDTRLSCVEPCRSYVANFDDVKDIEFLPGGNEFICCSNLVTRDSADRNIVAWDLRTGAVLSNQIFHERYHCTCLKVHPEGKTFLAQTNGDYIAVFSTQRPYKMNSKIRFEGHKVEGYWVGLDLSHDGHLVYSGSADGKVYAYNFYTGKICSVLNVSKEPCLVVESHPLLRSTIAVSSWSGKVHILY